MKKTGLTLILYAFVLTLNCQNEASFWYFGQRAGLQFDAELGTVTAVTDGQIDTLEGCTSISDENGDLLFYTDGQTVWNKNHQIMANGNYFGGTGLLGDPSSTSSGLIVPKPNDPDRYYVFTVDEPHHENAAVYPNQFNGVYNSGGGSVPGADDGFNNGLNYSLVDMTLNGGLGDVVNSEKNVPLITYDPSDNLEIRYKCSEKITAVRAEDCSSFWVITHFGDSFYAFKIEDTGVNTTPVISTVGPNVPIQGYRRNALGYIKASPDASKLLVAHFGFATFEGGDAGGGVYLYDFNNETGVVSNNVELYSPQNSNSPYGVEFSSETTKAYATIGFGIGGGGASQVLQWDLQAPDIVNSIQIVHTSNQLSAGALQLGIDKRIYRAQVDFGNFNSTGRFLGVINNPEEVGAAANYDEQGVLIDIGGFGQNLSRIGLPPFIQSLFNSQIDIIRNGESTTELKLCTGDTYTLTADDLPGADYVWSVDGNILPDTSFELVIDSPGFYEVYIEPNNGECPIEGNAVVGVFDIPVANALSDISICDDLGNDGVFSFDFTNKNPEALLSQDPNQYRVSYFERVEDANSFENEIMFPYQNISNPQTIFVRVDNRENPNCFDVNSFQLEVFNTPQIVPLEPIAFCDDTGDLTDGIASLDLATIIPNILGNQPENEIDVSFHLSLADADTKSNPLPLLFTNATPFTETLFARLENNLNTSCYNTARLELFINPIPTANDVTLLQCDEDGITDGFTIFNLTEAIPEITEETSDLDVSFYLTLNDAVNDSNPVAANAFNNTINPQTIVARVRNSITGCFDYANVTLDVSATATNDATLELCDDDGTEDGFTSFTLTDAIPDILAGIPEDLDVFFYATYNDALLESNPIGPNFTNTIPFNQTIYSRVEDENACYGISELTLTVFALPDIEVEDEVFYCLNFFPEPLILDGGVVNDTPNNYLYEWSTGETTSSIAVNETGTFTVRVSNVNGCYKERTVTVLPSNIATITDIEVRDLSQTNAISIFVSGEGDYEYAIDGVNGPYQDSNVFSNLNPGLYTVFVRDKNNCGISEEIVSVIGFPKFFTPNNDGTNDFWQVIGITAEIQPNSRIQIFDRFGKLLTELDPLSSGWDGTYNGVKMPTSDYWFRITLEDGRTYTSHFTLKR